MDSLLKLQVRSVYGTERIYPMNTQAQILADLIRKKTFTKEDVATMQRLGFAIEWVPIRPAA